MTGAHHDGNPERSGGAAAERLFPSTTYEWRRVKITRAPQASSHSVPKGHRWRRLPKRDPRQPLTITIKLRGGAESWVEVHARGDFARLPGSVCLGDLVMWVNSQTR